MLLILPFLGMAQNEKSVVEELSYMMPKNGSEAKFEAGVKLHNDKYHKSGGNKATLYLVKTGKNAGWYIWNMGPCSFADLDNRVAGTEHDADWDKNVTPHVAQYGPVNYFTLSTSLSNDAEANSPAPMLEIWTFNTPNGEYYRFKKCVSEITELMKEAKRGMAVYTTAFGQTDQPDVAIVWPIKDWASYDSDDFKIKKAYEAKYGEGTWMNFLKEWDAVHSNMNQEVWQVIK